MTRAGLQSGREWQGGDVCDVQPHDTGWKVIRVRRSASGMNNPCYSWLYLRCRTKNCIETRVKRIDGWWELTDFSVVYGA